MTATPTPIVARYQIVVLGAGAAVHEVGLRAAIEARTSELGEDVARGTVIHAGDTYRGQIIATAPAVVVYLGGDTTTNSAEVGEFVSASVPVLPIVPALDSFTTNVPAVLLPINGIALDWTAPDYAEAVNVVLEHFDSSGARGDCF